jgi:hypothetical protein
MDYAGSSVESRTTRSGYRLAGSGGDNPDPLFPALWSKLKVGSLSTGRTGNENSSAFELSLPLALFAAACALSFPTLVIAFAWMTIGVMSLGYRTLESFPTDGIRREWLSGYRAACLWFYHLAWWPRYMRSPLRDIADRIGRRRLTGKKSSHHGSEYPHDKVSDGANKTGEVGDAHSGRRD